MSIINRLGSRVEVKIRVRRAGMIAGSQSRNQRQTPVTRVSKTRFKRLLRNRAVLA
jgi:hypothetical protein